MNCVVFRSSRKNYTYLYLRAGLEFDDLPMALRGAFGQPEFVMELELSPERKLASENALEVLEHLRENGFYLQLPPGDQAGDLI